MPVLLWRVHIAHSDTPRGEVIGITIHFSTGILNVSKREDIART